MGALFFSLGDGGMPTASDARFARFRFLRGCSPASDAPRAAAAADGDRAGPVDEAAAAAANENAPAFRSAHCARKKREDDSARAGLIAAGFTDEVAAATRILPLAPSRLRLAALALRLSSRRAAVRVPGSASAAPQ